MGKYICIHGHFYQPPRENPWLEEVELQDSAYPYHDWNERITAECYAPNTASRILDNDGRIIDIVSNYSKISFNFGPTLLSWMERHRPETYQAIIDADRLSMENFSGHGSAIAQVYNHMIMPLANSRDKYTQILWGLRDFDHRFKRQPEGMWLPETAVDVATLEIMADLGILFTILAPHQAFRVKEIRKGARWQDVSNSKIDPTMPYLCRLPSGRKINLFFYDGPISRDIAFGGLLGDGGNFAKRLLNAFSETRKRPQLVHIATDGESYGHHHRGGDMALAYCLYSIESKKIAKLTNYGEYLDRHPPTHEALIYENSSWSCIHGVERWRDNCGCNSGSHSGWTQEWRKPLREALDELRFATISIYEDGAGTYLNNPWKARDDYISVILNRSEANIGGFLRNHAIRALAEDEIVNVLKFMEMQRHAMLMYTSCGWFFDEISGIETTQIMQYASKVMQLAADLHGASLEQDFLDTLGNAPSNLYENGVTPYTLFVKSAEVDLSRVGAHYAISSVFCENPEQTELFCFTAKSVEYDITEAENRKLVTGKARVISAITLEKKTISFAVLHLGYHNIIAGICELTGADKHLLMQKEIKSAFEKGDMTSVAGLIHDHFGANIFSLSHLFRDEQRKIVQQILTLAYEGLDETSRKTYEDYYDIMVFLESLHVPVPETFTVAAGYIINRDLKRVFDAEEIDTDRLKKLIDEIKKWSIKVDSATVGFVASVKINTLIEKLSVTPEDIQLIEKTESALKLMSALPVQLDLWKAQNVYFSIGKKLYDNLKGTRGDNIHQKWAESFRKLGFYLHVKIA